MSPIDSAKDLELSPTTMAVHGGPLFIARGFSAEQLKAAGVSPATVRFAVGIEAAEDIIADITQALDTF